MKQLLTNDCHYSFMFLEMIENNAAKLKLLHNLFGKDLETTKRELLYMISYNVGHGVSKDAFSKLETIFSRIHTFNNLMITMSNISMNSYGLKVK